MVSVDNKSLISKLRLIFFFLVILYVSSILLMYSFDVMNIETLLLISVCVVTLKFIIIYCIDANRIIFINEKNNFIIRYYPLRLQSVKYTSIEMTGSEFSHFKISSKYMGMLTYIVLYKNTINGLAKFPPVNISFLSNKQKINLLISLKEYMLLK